MNFNKISRKSNQRGMSFVGVVLFGAVVVACIAIGAKSFPMWSEYFTIQKAAQKASLESSALAVRASFDRTASVDYFDSIGGKDLDVKKVGDKFQVSFNYSREVHLAGPAYLVYRFEWQSK